MDDFLVQPVVQYGFLGFSAVLLGIVVWLIKCLLGVLDATNKIIAANTEAIREVRGTAQDLLQLNRAVYEKLLTRPCIAAKE